MADDNSMSRKVGSFVIAAVLVLGAFFIGAALTDWSPFRSITGQPFEEVGPTVVESVKALSELTTVEVVEYTTIEKGNDFGWLNWARGDKIFMFAVARIGAGVDLAKMNQDSFEVDLDSGIVTVRLPSPEILYVSLDNEATQVYDRSTGVFTKGDPRLESEARLAAEQILVDQALQAEILDMAEDNAITTLRQFLLGLGYEDVYFVKTPRT